MYEWRSHTAELELFLEADSEPDVFRAAVAAFAELVEPEPGGAPARHVVELEGAENGALLVALLEELVYLADTEGFVPEAAEIRLQRARLIVELDGRQTRVKPLVKAATYHRLRFERADGVWQARVVLDV